MIIKLARNKSKKIPTPMKVICMKASDMACRMPNNTINNNTVAKMNGTKIRIANSLVTTERTSLIDRPILRIPAYFSFSPAKEVYK